MSRPIWARLFARQAEDAEAKGIHEKRVALLSGLRGRVLEIGAGTGLNFPHYPETVTEVVALEPESYLADLSESRIGEAQVPVTVQRGAAETLPFADDEFDAVVSFHVLCSVDDPKRVLAEAGRVLKPGGELRFNEHVASPNPRRASLQRGADLIWPHVAGGCHLGRETEASIRAAGFTTIEIEHYSFGIPPLDPPKSHILGIAVPAPAEGQEEPRSQGVAAG